MSTLNTIKIQDAPELVRDMGSKAVVSVDAQGLGRYKEQRRRMLAANQENLETKKRLATIEGEMANLKRILSELTVLRSRG
jgi:urease alpha subunit